MMKDVQHPMFSSSSTWQTKSNYLIHSGVHHVFILRTLLDSSGDYFMEPQILNRRLLLLCVCTRDFRQCLNICHREVVRNCLKKKSPFTSHNGILNDIHVVNETLEMDKIGFVFISSLFQYNPIMKNIESLIWHEMCKVKLEKRKISLQKVQQK